MRPASRLVLIATVCLVALLALLRGIGAGAQTTAPATEPLPPMVAVALAVRTAFTPRHRAPGSVLSREDARVAGEAGGRVERVVEVGERIRRGELLARLDDTALRLREREDQAGLARIRAQLELATRQEARYAQLLERGGVSGVQLDEVRAEREMLAQDLARAQVSLEQTRHQRSLAGIRAPFDGVVAERYIQPGEYLAPGAAVVRLVNTDALEVRVRAPVALGGHLVVGMPVRLEGVGERRIAALVPVGDEASRQLELRIALEAGELPVGAALDVDLPSAEPREVLAVPRDAIVMRREGDYVMRVGADDLAERVPVVVGESLDGLVEVEGELSAGDRLVVRGGERLQAGQRVAWDGPVGERVSAR